MSGELLASWCEIPDGAKELVEAGYDPDRMIEESRLKAVESQPALEGLLDWFLEEVAGEGQAADPAG
jgi:hypothetical protein